MKWSVFAFLACLIGMLGGNAGAQSYDTNNVLVQPFVGSAFYGYYDGRGELTMFNYPTAVVADSHGNLFVADRNNNRIRKITPDGTVSTFAGGGPGGLPGFGTNVSLSLGYYYSSGGTPMAIDRADVLWVVANGALLRIGPDAFVSLSGVNNLSPAGICVDSANDLYFPNNNQIYRYRPSNGALEVFAGSGNPGSADGNWIFTSFSNPTAMAADAAGNIYVWDSGTRLIRRINQARDVVTIAGTNTGYYCYQCDQDGVGPAASFSSVDGMTVDGNGNLLLACGTSVRKLTAATNVVTLAGSFSWTGHTNGPGALARFSGASAVCVSRGEVFVADRDNHRIRKITFNTQPEPVASTHLKLNTYAGLEVTGDVGRTYQIESSTNLNTWNTEATILLPKSPHLWIDPKALGPGKYYRAFLLP